MKSVVFTVPKFVAIVFLLARATVLPAATVALTELDLSHLHVAAWRAPQVDKAISGKPLSIGGRKFERGIGTRATSTLWLELDGKVEKFSALVGVDDDANTPEAAVRIQLVGDGRRLWDSGVTKRGEPAKVIDIDLQGVRSLLVTVNHAGKRHDQNFADLAEPRFSFSGAPPCTVIAPREEAIVLTPKPPLAPRINGPKIYGCRPGHPFIYRIPTTGERPIAFAADLLPAGLQLDPVSGIITGSAPARGRHAVVLRGKNRHGGCARAFDIVSGDTLALTPPMGWNHWYAHYQRITDAMMREAADAMLKTGMADVGYSYVNIDNCWMNAAPDAKPPLDPRRIGPFRDAAGNILPNIYFPDMRALTDYIHSHGLKAGIYTSPGPLTCGRYAGSYQHEEQDAKQFAAWGFDFLKYDWCTYRSIVGDDRSSLPMLMQPYQQMGEILKRLSRDILFNFSQKGMGEVWKWGAEVGGHSWRTGGDLGGELNQIFEVALKNARHGPWSKPGAWNDPDYIQIGRIGPARTHGEPVPSPLTATEQYSFVSLWSLMAAPLFYSGDLRQIDEFTLNVLCNPEVIAINQDTLGECARVVMLTPETFLMVKNLDDGSKAVGLCNADEVAREVTAAWRDIGVSGKQQVRDVWRQRDIGELAGQFQATVPRHGVILLRLQMAAP